MAQDYIDVRAVLSGRSSPLLRLCGCEVCLDVVDTYVALLRGINVGGKNKLPMRNLVAIFADAGAKDVTTHVQSGNVVFGATRAVIGKLATVVATDIEARLGLKVPVVLRRCAEMSRLHAENPYTERVVDPRGLHVAFLRDLPTASATSAFQRRSFLPDEYTLKGTEVFLHCPNGIGRSKLTVALFDRCLTTVTTIRNWNTVCALAQMCRDRRAR